MIFGRYVILHATHCVHTQLTVRKLYLSSKGSQRANRFVGLHAFGIWRLGRFQPHFTRSCHRLGNEKLFKWFRSIDQDGR